ncbi:MAG: alpha-galactosidase [Alphaproteobacteria bacterium]|jgi:alpha-galactosidase|nr:alpha-galactosidase [Alphaproteobacteria bacterium]
MTDDRLIRLDGGGATCLIDARGPGLPRPVHWGAALPGDVDLAAIADAAARPMPNAVLDRDVPPSLMPEAGFGAFGLPAIAVERDRRDWATAFRLTGVAPLDTRQGTGVRLDLADRTAGLGLVLELTIDAETGVQARRATLENRGAEPVRLSALAAAVIDVPVDAAEALVFDGQWNGEMIERRQALGPGQVVRENRRGRTSHDQFPGLMLGRPGFGEETGAVWGVHLGWSGNHRLAVERTVDGTQQIHLAPLLLPGEVVLAEGEGYTTPWAYAGFAEDGLTGLADRFHRFVRARVVDWPGGAMRPRPVHMNTWEAVYFDHDLATLKRLADAAAAVGVERFVLDDGWFGRRDDDTTSLGDWTPDPRKWPDGLGPIAEHVRDRGMEFGLWVEPEMVNPDSDLYRAHPDWTMHLPDRDRPTGRNQLVLDLTRAEVSDYLFDALDRVLRATPIAYLKWDMNRDLAPAARTGDAAGLPGADAQARAVWALIDRLRAAHPEVEIESCASGGGRADWGMLARTHRFWPSDNNDALSRQAIQAGWLRFFPPEVMGAHVGPAPGHTTGRRLDLGFRCATALIGHMGIEADLLALTDAERATLSAALALHKAWRPVIHGGRFRRFEPAAAGRQAYGVIAAEGDRALVVVAQTAESPTRFAPPLRLPGLDSARTWRLRLALPAPDGARFTTPALAALAGDGLVLPGAGLTTVGLQLPVLWPETALVIAATTL